MDQDAIELLLSSVTTEAPVEAVRVGALCTAVVIASNPPVCGLASTRSGQWHDDGPPVREAGHLEWRSVRELAELLRSPRSLEASIGMAAVNAALAMEDVGGRQINGADLVRERARDKRLAIIGHFPFADTVGQESEAYAILELEPRGDDLPASEAHRVLPHADVVVISGTSLINHTFEQLMGLCRPDAYIVVLGPSAPLSRVLFEWPVDAVGGARVEQPQRALALASEGAAFSQIKRAGAVRLLTLER
jgi:hypothetical protein